MNPRHFDSGFWLWFADPLHVLLQDMAWELRSSERTEPPAWMPTSVWPNWDSPPSELRFETECFHLGQLVLNLSGNLDAPL